MEYIFIGGFTVVIFGLVAVVYTLNQKLSSLKQTSSVDLLKTDLIELSRDINQLRDGLKDTVSDRLDRNNASIQRHITESTKIVADVSRRLAKLDDTNKRVVDVADELKTLQNVLQNPKQRGVFGEFYLHSVLDNVLPPGQFQVQYKFKDGEIVDAAIFLEKGNILPVDSKFSLENYNRMVNAETKAEKDLLMAKVRNDLKLRIDETSKYIRPSEKTMDFAFMFIPSESLYYDLLIGSVGAGSGARDLIEYAFQEKRVIIVSPTSFMAYLQTVLQGLRSLQIESQAKDIQKRVGELGRHIAVYETYMQKLGSSLGTTVNHYNTAHKELRKIDKDIIKISDTAQAVDPLTVDRPQQD